MSREVVLKDDIDGSANAETHILRLDDRNVTIDLSKANYDKLIKFLTPYLDAGKARGAPASANGHATISYADVREWARKKRIKGVPDRGRLSQDLIDRYLQDTSVAADD